MTLEPFIYTFRCPKADFSCYKFLITRFFLITFNYIIQNLCIIHIGARVIILARDMQKARAAAEEINKLTGSTVAVYQLDLADLTSVRHTAEVLKEQEPKIHILINNAGEIVLN